MLNQSVSPRVPRPTPVGTVLPPLVANSRLRPAAIPDRAALDALLDDEESPVEWSEEDIVFLHWRLLQEVSQLADPATPLAEKFDTLRWVFSEREKDGLPFSFVSCLRVVGCSPLSPIAYCGRVDAEDVRDRILFIQAIETVRCVEENVLLSTADANIGSIFGIGFAAWTGGALQYINQYGVKDFVARAQYLAEQYGERFLPPALLLEKAAKGEQF